MTDSDSFSIDFKDDDSGGLGFVRRDSKLLDPASLNVYLAGPMTNNDDDANQECQEVRHIVKQLLHGYDFLGVKFRVYDPADVTPPGTYHSPEDVYATDYQSTVSAELIVFHVNTPSLGVGMESQISAYATIPRVIICKQGTPVSRMFRGVFAPTLAKIEYDSPADARTQLESKIGEIAGATIESAEKRRPIVSDLSELRMGRRILKQRILKRMTIQHLAAETDIREFWLLRLEREMHFFATSSFTQFLRICYALDCYASFSMDGAQIKFSSDQEDQLSVDQKISLENLALLIETRDHGTSDAKVFSLWDEYVEQDLEQLAEAGKLRSSGEHVVVTIEEWKRRYDEMGLF